MKEEDMRVRREIACWEAARAWGCWGRVRVLGVCEGMCACWCVRWRLCALTVPKGVSFGLFQASLPYPFHVVLSIVLLGIVISILAPIQRQYTYASPHTHAQPHALTHL